ncbi:MAG: protein kinase domain-containing protein [Phycisphaerales bacterium]
MSGGRLSTSEGVDVGTVSLWSRGGAPPSMVEIVAVICAEGRDEVARRTLIFDAERRAAGGETATLEAYGAVDSRVLERPGLCRALLMCEASRRVGAGEEAEHVRRDLVARLPTRGGEIGVVMGLVEMAREESAEGASAGGADSGQGERGHSPGEKVGKYTLHERLGGGAFGEVWRATDGELSRDVALKILHGAPGGTATDALLREARAAAAVVHEHAVTVHDAGVIDGWLCIDSALVAERGGRGETRVGRSLQDEVAAAGPMSGARAAALVEGLARALAAAHARGVLHRDVKPGNVLLTPSGRGLITDFGLAAMVSGGGPEGGTGAERARVVGTPAFMAPEQARGESPTPQSDVFGLGATLRFALTGRPAYEPSGRHSSDARRDVLLQAREGVPVKGWEVGRGIDLDLVAIANRATAREPGERYTSADQLGADLRAYLASRPTMARPPSTLRGLRMWVRRHAAPVAVGAVAVTVIVAGTWRFVTAVTDERDRARKAEVAAVQALAEAARQRDTALMLNRFTGEITGAALRMNEDRPTTLIETLALADRRLQYALRDRPLLEAGARHMLGGASIAVRDPVKAREHLEKALIIRERDLGPEAPDTLRTARLLAMASAKDKAEEARAMVQLLPRLETHLGASDTDTCAARIIVATSLRDAGDHAGAEREYRLAEAGLREGGALGTFEWQEAAWGRASAVVSLGRIDEGVELYRGVVETAGEVLGKSDLRAMNTRYNFARILIVQARIDDAERALRTFLADALAALGPTHAGTVFAHTVLGEFLGTHRHDAAGALELARRAIPEQVRDKVTPSSRYRVELLMGRALVNLGERAEATRVLEGIVTDGAKRKMSENASVKGAIDLLERLRAGTEGSAE